jgi:hypothetical protein
MPLKHWETFYWARIDGKVVQIELIVHHIASIRASSDYSHHHNNNCSKPNYLVLKTKMSLYELHTFIQSRILIELHFTLFILKFITLVTFCTDIWGNGGGLKTLLLYWISKYSGVHCINNSLLLKNKLN